MFGIKKGSRDWEGEYDNYDSQDDLRQTQRKSNLRRMAGHGLALLVGGGVLLGGVGVINGSTMVEKTLTELASPLGLVWLMLLVMVYFCFLQQQIWPAWIGLVCWLLLTLGGNSLVSNWLVSTLEAPYRDINVFQLEKFDSLIVLGGGTSYRSIGSSQFGDAGDRVGLAARLYHTGKTDRIICTGSSIYRISETEPHAREQSAELLVGLKVPADKIDLVEGENTSQEMRNLKIHFDSIAKGNGRYGLITSAAHLPRALRLAEQNGLQLIPVPADVRGHEFRPNPNVIVPGADSLAKTKSVYKEYLAWLLGR